MVYIKKDGTVRDYYAERVAAAGRDPSAITRGKKGRKKKTKTKIMELVGKLDNDKQEMILKIITDMD